jgi:hypothetical protein
MKVCGGVDVQIHILLTSALVGGQLHVLLYEEPPVCIG